jgi:hypothetical protein
MVDGAWRKTNGGLRDSCYRRNRTMPKSPVLGMPLGTPSAPRHIARASDKAARVDRPGTTHRVVFSYG